MTSLIDYRDNLLLELRKSFSQLNWRIANKIATDKRFKGREIAKITGAVDINALLSKQLAINIVIEEDVAGNIAVHVWFGLDCRILYASERMNNFKVEYVVAGIADVFQLFENITASLRVLKD